MMNKTYKNQTSIDASNGEGFGPVNQFNPVRELTDPEDRSVVAPNYDTLYSIAWLNLKNQPQIIHVPKVKDRYFVIPLMDPYTEDFHNLGTVEGTKPGDYAVVGPNSGNVKLPKGVEKIEASYDRVWIIERTYVDSDVCPQGRQARARDPGRDHGDAAQALRPEGLEAAEAVEPGHDRGRSGDADRAALLRPTRQAAREVPAPG